MRTTIRLCLAIAMLSGCADAAVAGCDCAQAGAELEVDRQRIVPLSAGTVQVVRGTSVLFDVGPAIVNPSGAPVYVSWWLNFDANDPNRTAEIQKNGSTLEVSGCEIMISGEGPHTARLEALVSTADRIVLDPEFLDQRVGPDGEAIVIVHWTLAVSGDTAACIAAGGL